MTLTQPNSQQTLAQPAEAYLADLRAHLRHIPPAEREEILHEIAAHIRDSVETGTPINTVIARLGPPAQLAAEYSDGQLIRAASRSLSPVKLLRATLRVATKGVTGILVFLRRNLRLCLRRAGLFITGILKALFPAYTGIWRRGTPSRRPWHAAGHGPQHRCHETSSAAGTSHRLLHRCRGHGILTTLAIRGFLRLSQQVQRSL